MLDRARARSSGGGPASGAGAFTARFAKETRFIALPSLARFRQKTPGPFLPNSLRFSPVLKIRPRLQNLLGELHHLLRGAFIAELVAA
jgi:hypothetical protein